MKKLRMTLFLSLLFMVVTAFTLQAEVSIVGTWTFKYCWGCGSTYSSTTIIFLSDNTFKTGTSSTIQGDWYMVGHEIQWVYTSGTTYSGSKIGSSVQGMMHSYSGSTGCFYLTYVSSATSASALSKSPDSSLQEITVDGAIRLMDDSGY